MPYVNVDSKNIYYEEYGNRDFHTIVYFHGGPGESCLSYTHQAEVLGEKYHVISFDQYGVFRSDALADSQPFGVKAHVRLADKIRIALGINSWTPLGHSYGGMLAALYAYLYPENTEAVIYDCPMWSVLLTSKTAAGAFFPYYEKNQIEDKLQICKEIMSDEITPKAAFEKMRSLELDENLKRFCHVIDSDTYVNYMSEYIPAIDTAEENWYKYIDFTRVLLSADDFYENYLFCIKEIEKPSLLIVGEYDITCGKDQQRYFCKYSKNGHLVILEKSAHLSWIQYPEKYTRIICDFMDRLV